MYFAQKAYCELFGYNGNVLKSKCHQKKDIAINI